MKITQYIIIILLLINCKTTKNKDNSSNNYGLIVNNAMVVSAREEASKIGVEIMQKGGNVFDAMIATEMALAVAYPFAGNLGGGGFMVYRLHDGEVGSLDYREKAPIKSDENMYLDNNGDVIPNLSEFGALAIGVPGTIAGIFEVHKKFGTMPISEILKPVIELAEKGVIVTKKQYDRLNEYRDIFLKINNGEILYSKNWKVGDTIKNINLANTLKRISMNGRDEFYKGETGQKLVNIINKYGGIFTMKDLELYEAKWRNPIQFKYKELNVISMPPPSSGGITLNQIFNMIEPFNVGSFDHNSDEYISIITEAERRAYADRNYFLGDPDFVDIPISQLLSQEYLKFRMSNYDKNKATKSSEVSHGNIEFIESNETTHYSIVDQNGNAVSVTTTLNGAYGSKLYSNDLGFFLNNEMDDFSSKPGMPNMYGLIGAENNKIQPQKRMLSSMSPTIVEKNNELYIILGTPGGSTIITSVLQTILNIYEFNMTAQQAVSSGRFHHQWMPDLIKLEPNYFDIKTIKKLESKSYNIDQSNSIVIGKVEVILKRKDGKYEGGADPRGDDKSVGY